MSDYHANKLAQSIHQQTTSPKDPCPDIGVSYALFRTLREESSRKLPPRDTTPTYMDKVRTGAVQSLPTFSHPYADKMKHARSDVGSVTAGLYAGVSQPSIPRFDSSLYGGKSSSSTGYRVFSESYGGTRNYG
ncbi:hypothetical protein HYX13_03935 [Candidatus Woesearchaeota archaeon]|nr:hypothetical protein [Candidatus Woesearchaeota archaeon]